MFYKFFRSQDSWNVCLIIFLPLWNKPITGAHVLQFYTDDEPSRFCCMTLATLFLVPTGETGEDMRFALCHSVCHNSFPDFSILCFHIHDISEWKLVANFHMKSNRLSSTFFTVDVLFYELFPFFKIRFPGFSWIFSHISAELKLVTSASIRRLRD